MPDRFVGETAHFPAPILGAEEQRMKISRGYLAVAVVCLGLIAFIGVVMGLISSQRHRYDAQLSVAASALAVQPGPAATQPSPESDTIAPGGFGSAQDDTTGYDGHAWGASVADVAGRRGNADAAFTEDTGGYNGPLDLPTIIWMGIGLPANHQRAQASTFDPASFGGAQWSTVRRGNKQYIFVDGHFVMAVAAEDARMYDAIRQKLATQEQQIPSLHMEQTFDLAERGSGLPPDTISTECFRRPNTNTRVYLIEKWSSSLLGTVTFHRVFVVTIPNAYYQTLLNEATHPTQASTTLPATAHP
jgi:hypothetical protein